MLGFPDWTAFHERLMYWRGRVDWHFARHAGSWDEEEGEESELMVGASGYAVVGRRPQDEEAACRQLQEGGFTDAPKALKTLGRPAQQSAIACHAAPGL